MTVQEQKKGREKTPYRRDRRQKLEGGETKRASLSLLSAGKKREGKAAWSGGVGHPLWIRHS